MTLHCQDPGAKGFTPFRDGRLLEDCYAASEEGGWADCYKRDASGHFLVVNGEVATERLQGRIELRGRW